MNRICNLTHAISISAILVTCCFVVTCVDVKTKSNTKIYTIVSGPIQNSGIDVLAFSPDGIKILAGCRDNSVKMIDMSVNPGSVLKNLEHNGWVHAVAFSADGSKMYSGSVDGAVNQWDTNTGTLINSLNLDARSGDKANSIYPMKDTNKILVSGMAPTAKIIDLKEKNSLHRSQTTGKL